MTVKWQITHWFARKNYSTVNRIAFIVVPLTNCIRSVYIQFLSVYDGFCLKEKKEKVINYQPVLLRSPPTSFFEARTPGIPGLIFFSFVILHLSSGFNDAPL